MLRNLASCVTAFSLVFSSAIVMAAGGDGKVSLSCPEGTKQFGGRETMTDRGVFCVRVKSDGGMPIAHGPYVSYHSNGQLKVLGQHVDGAQAGLWKFFDENGVMQEQIEFSGGNYNGQRVQFFPSGKVRLEERWVNGKREGTAVAYTEDGRKLAEFEYRGGHLVKEQRFDSKPPVSDK